jgi:hypothetical protein
MKFVQSVFFAQFGAKSSVQFATFVQFVAKSFVRP